MGTDNTEVQSLINKVLSTDNAQNTADEMDRKIKENNSDKFFNIYSPHFKMKLWQEVHPGKIIGEHSNAVVLFTYFNNLLIHISSLKVILLWKENLYIII